MLNKEKGNVLSMKIKKYKILVILFITVGIIKAEIKLDGALKGILQTDEYYVDKNFQVDDTLLVNKGTKLIFNEDTKIKVKGGVLKILGTEDQPVLITTSSDTSEIVVDSIIELQNMTLQSDSKGKLLFNDAKINEYNKYELLNVNDVNIDRRSKVHAPLRIISGLATICFGTLAIINEKQKDDYAYQSSEYEKHEKRFEAFTYLSASGVLAITIDVIVTSGGISFRKRR